jgi:hypothetical protein
MGTLRVPISAPDFQMPHAAFAKPEKDYKGCGQQNHKAEHQQNHNGHNSQTDGIGSGVN